jgi:hypothetical protein
VLESCRTIVIFYTTKARVGLLNNFGLVLVLVLNCSRCEKSKNVFFFFKKKNKKNKNIWYRKMKNFVL